ncbi:MAG: amidohydrolase family protein [Phycisphaerales bacterium]|nr:amidohydrolase family protein [Phycisphaerales bacterium]
MSIEHTNLREGHAHLFQLGRSLTMVDLSACASRDEMIDLLSERSKSLPDDGWVLAQGARPDGWNNPRWPSRQELDRACDGKAVVAWCFDYHQMVASSSALHSAGIDADTAVESGRIELDTDGKPTGLLIEHAALKMWSSVPEPSVQDRYDIVRSACLHLESMGFVEMHELKTQPWVGGVLSDLYSGGEIKLRSVLFPLMKDLRETIKESENWNPDAVRMGGGKIFVDGTFNSRTAWMLEPFADGNPEYPCGTPMMKTRQIDRMMSVCKEHELPLAAHAIGDGAVRAVLDAIERTSCAHTGCRIEHAELIDESDIGRFKELGVIASLQPCHLLPDIEALNKAVPNRLDRVFPIRELIESGLEPGVDLIFGSDVPIVRANPEDSIQAAVHRRRVGMAESEAINFDQRITEEQAWACFGYVAPSG